MSETPADAARPIASWVSLGFGLVALACSLFVLLSGDFIDALEATPKDDPWLMVALVGGIVGTIAGIVALARKEPWRLAVLALTVSVVAAITKFFLAALLVVIVLFIAFAVIANLG